MQHNQILNLLYEDESDGTEFTDSSSEFYFSSSSSSEAEEEPEAKTTRIVNFLDTINEYTDLQFRQHFRLNRPVAEGIIEDYQSRQEREEHGGREEIGANREIYIVLWYLANTETYRQISDRFDVTRSSVYRTLRRVIGWLVRESPRYIKWPTDSEREAMKFKFFQMKSFPKVIGAIDGCHIAIKAPKNNREAFYNRKGYYSVLLQGVVDADKKFIDVHCGEAGSMHDARLFRKSNLFRIITNQPNFMTDCILLGDSAYPLNNYLVTPYKDFGNLSSKQKKFNYLHSATRIVVENAFGLLKNRFRRLRFFESPCIGFISNCIVAACVLHNICISANDSFEMPEEAQTTFEGPHLSVEGSNSETNRIRELIFCQFDNEGLLN